MANTINEALEVIIDPLIEINKSPIAYSILETLYKYQNGLQPELLEGLVLPEQEKTPASYIQFRDTLVKLKEMDVIDYKKDGRVTNISLTLKGAEAYRADRAANVTVLSSIHSELAKDGIRNDEEIKKEIREIYLLTLEEIQKNVANT